VPPEAIGKASGINSTMRELGVDLLNADDLDKLQKFLLEEKKG